MLNGTLKEMETQVFSVAFTHSITSIHHATFRFGPGSRHNDQVETILTLSVMVDHESQVSRRQWFKKC